MSRYGVSGVVAIAIVAMACGAGTEGDASPSESALSATCAARKSFTEPTKCGELTSGQGLGQGKSLLSCDGRFELQFKTDGNLVLSSAGVVLWWSGSWDKGGYETVMQSDGNLVIYTKAGCPIWASDTSGHSGSHFALQNDGNAVVYHGTKALWSSGTGSIGTAPSSCGVMAAGQGLSPGERLTSCDGSHSLLMGTNGNLVVDGPDGSVIWAAGTTGTPYRFLDMKTDGNLVVYKHGHVAVWSSGTAGDAGTSLALQNDGNLVVSDNGTTLWQTGPVLSTERQWLAGYAGDVTASGQSAFAAAYGFTPQVVAAYATGVGSWSEVDGIFATNAVAFFPGSNAPEASINLISIGLTIGTQASVDTAEMQNAAAGGDVANWTAVGNAIIAANMNYKNTVIRLGHEANGNWYTWSTNGDPTLMGYYQAGWIYAYNAVHAVAPNVRFELCLNAGSNGDSMIAGHYPGDAYVDILGFDFYNFGNGTTPTQFADEQGQPGFTDVPAFARAHGKLFSVSEWGLNGNDATAATRDIPAFIQWMYDQFAAIDVQYPGIVSHDVYFNQSGNFLLSSNPNSAALYKQLWSAPHP